LRFLSGFGDGDAGWKRADCESNAAALLAFSLRSDCAATPSAAGEAMSTEKLERSEWEGYFDLLSKQLGPENAEVELATLKVGDRIALDSVSLIGLSYNPKDDVFELATAAADHRIQHPRAIHLDEGPDGIRRIEVIDADDIREVIELAPPLPRPSP
jgi:hypothetical protein